MADTTYLQGLRLRVREGDCMAMAEFAQLALQGGAVVEVFLMFYRTADIGRVE